MFFSRYRLPKATLASPPTSADVQAEVEEAVQKPELVKRRSVFRRLHAREAFQAEGGIEGAEKPALAKRPSLLRRLHARNTSAGSTTTATSTSSFANSISSVTSSIRAAKRRSVQFVAEAYAAPTFDGQPVMDDSYSGTSDDSDTAYDVIF